MTDALRGNQKISASQRRWACVGPYYAMFPMDYVVRVIQKYTVAGDAVLDPFAGRYSVPAVASYLGRNSCGVEISPVGWLYGRVKQGPAMRFGDLDRRLREMRDLADQFRSEARSMGEFFARCYSPDVLRFLLACRAELKWQTSLVDGTLMACLLIVLHHGIGRGLSNQMRQAKAMAPQYSIRWWKANGMSDPPKVDPVRMLRRKLQWRYACGVFRYPNSLQVHGDSSSALETPRVTKWAGAHDGIKLLFTSPPYSSVVNYYKDQWLRLWMLGADPSPKIRTHEFQKSFSDKEAYRKLIRKVFRSCAELMRDDGVVVVRVDTRKFTFQTVRDALADLFPEYDEIEMPIYTRGKTQTRLYNNIRKKCQECDLVLGRV